MTRNSPSLASQLVSPTILIVDDTRDFVEFLRLLLSHEGFNIRCAFSGSEGLEYVRTEPIDLVILDVMMPNMDGLTVCAELKRLAPELPVILLTAKDDLATRAAAMNLGVSEFLAKPVNIEDFLTRVRTQIHIHEWGKNIDDTFAAADHQPKSLADET
jgi:two-component system response regulator MprA